ncbi:hypothetical protein PTKIN_Ptkin05aG0127600 [Pterospermum kingtungense]
MATVLDSHFLALTAIVTVGYQIFFFIITALLKFDKVTDFAGSTNFIIIAVLTLVIKGSWHFRQLCFSGSLDFACSNMGPTLGNISIDEYLEPLVKLKAIEEIVCSLQIQEWLHLIQPFHHFCSITIYPGLQTIRAEYQIVCTQLE